MPAERDQALSTLCALYATCAAGRGGVALIAGAAGAGKTTLLHDFIERVAAEGGISLRAAGARSEQSTPLGVLRQLLSEAEQARGGALAALKPAAAEDRQRLADALRANVEKHPVVIGVDDLHHADTASLEWLLALARRIRSTRILLVLTEQLFPPAEYLPFRAELLRLPHSGAIRLRPLTSAEVADLLAGDIEATAAVAMTGGNPLLLRALLAEGSGWTRPVPGGPYGQAVEICLYSSRPATLRTAQALAALGDASAGTLAEVLDLSAHGVAQSLAELEATGLLVAGRLRHPALRTAILNALTPEERSALHLRAAEVLHDRGEPASVVARHLIDSAAVRSSWSGPILAEAAEGALDQGDVEFAVKCLRVAREMSREERHRAELTLALARAEWRLSPYAAARHLTELTGAARQDLLASEHITPLIALLLWDGRGEEALTLLAGGEPEHVRAWLRCCYPGLAGRFQPVSAAGSPRRGADLLTAALGGSGADALVTDAGRLLEGTPLSERALASLVAALVCLVYLGRPTKAGTWCAALAREAADRKAPAWQALFSSIGAVIHVQQGELAEADLAARQALTLMSPKSWAAALGLPLAAAVFANSAMGRSEEAASFLCVPVPEATFQTLGGLYYLQARGRHHLSVDRLHAALDDFQACGRLMGEWNLDHPRLVGWRGDAAQVHLAMGDATLARELVREQLARLGSKPCRARGISLRVLAAAVDVRRRPALLKEAIAILRRYGDRYELALALNELGRAHHLLGRESQARAMARRSRQLLESCGAPPPARKPEPVAAPPPADIYLTGPFTKLSEAELRVASLAAGGHTNREISDDLHVTVKTVEQHLTRVYRKLSLRHRKDLSIAFQNWSTGFGSGGRSHA